MAEDAEFPHTREVKIDGRGIRVGVGSPAEYLAQSASSENAAEWRFDVGPMAWSLGRLGDLLWLRLPEMRHSITRCAVDELDDAVDQGRALEPLSPYRLCSDFYDEILRPAIEGVPSTYRLLARAAQVLHCILETDPGFSSLEADAMAARVLSRISFDVDVPILASVDAELGRLLAGQFRQTLLN